MTIVDPHIYIVRKSRMSNPCVLSTLSRRDSMMIPKYYDNTYKQNCWTNKADEVHGVSWCNANGLKFANRPLSMALGIDYPTRVARERVIADQLIIRVQGKGRQ